MQDVAKIFLDVISVVCILLVVLQSMIIEANSNIYPDCKYELDITFTIAFLSEKNTSTQASFSKMHHLSFVCVYL